MHSIQSVLPALGNLQLLPIQPLISAVAFFMMLGILVFVHELGHFAVARWMGIHVEEFGFGYPPRMLTLFEREGVKYTLNWLPLGGFVRFKGEDNTLYGVGSLAAAKPWRKIPVMLAGPFMNLFLAMIIFALLFAIKGVPTPTGEQHVNEVYTNTPAAKAGFQPGDVLVSLDGQTITKSEMIRDIADNNKDQTILAIIRRNGEELTLNITPTAWVAPNGDKHESGLGISYAPSIKEIPVSLPEAFEAGISYTINVLQQMFVALMQIPASIGNIFASSDSTAGEPIGPVGIARATGEVIERGGFIAFWNLTALLSLNLFLLNLLPIPALDGSHIFFSLIEWVRGGKKVPPDKEAMVHAIGFASLMGLMILISVNDVINAFQGRSVLGG